MNKIFAIVAVCASVNAVAAVPLKWNVETSKVQPVMFEAVRGESLALEATFLSYGTPIAMRDCCLFWQTNGMKSAWWVTPAVSVSATGSTVSNIVKATFTAAMDPGAMLVNCFLGSTGENYRATFTLRYRNGPGATPNALPLPTTVIDCAKVTFLHPEAAPFSGGGATDLTPATNYTDACCSTIATASTNYTNAAIINNVTSGYLCTVAMAQAMTNALPSWTKSANKPTYNQNEIVGMEYAMVGYATGAGMADYAIEIKYMEGDIEYNTASFGEDHNMRGKNMKVLGQLNDMNVWEPFAYLSEIPPAPDFTTNNLALVSTITNLAPSKARGISLHDPVRNCNWYQAVTNGVFYWLVEE